MTLEALALNVLYAAAQRQIAAHTPRSYPTATPRETCVCAGCRARVRFCVWATAAAPDAFGRVSVTFS